MTELEGLLQLGPEAVERSLQASPRPLLLSGPWHGLAEGAGWNARRDFDAGDEGAGQAWARCAIHLYDGLATDVSASFRLSAMGVRAWAIRACGTAPGDEVLDAESLFAWARAALVITLDEALERSGRHPSELSIEDLRQLREMKNRLTVLETLSEVASIPPDLRPWFAARGQLV